MSRFWKSMKDAVTALRFVRKEFRDFGVEEYAAIAKGGKQLEARNINIMNLTEAEQKAALTETVNFLQKMKADGVALSGLTDETLSRMKSPNAASFDDLRSLTKELERMQTHLKTGFTGGGAKSVTPTAAASDSLVDRAMQQRITDFAAGSRFANDQEFLKSFLTDLKKQVEPTEDASKETTKKS